MKQPTATREGVPAPSEATYLLVLNAAEGAIQYLIARMEAAPPAPGAHAGPAETQPVSVPAEAALPVGDAHSPCASSLGGPLRLLCAHDWHAPSQGAELLAPALAHALERLDIRPAAIGRIACVRGPGSFTGLRLVLATAAGLARTTGALQGGIEYLPLLANGAANAWATWNSAPCTPGSQAEQATPPPCAAQKQQTLPEAPGAQAAPSLAALPPHQPASPVYWVLTHARRNLVHAQAFTHTPHGVLPASEILVLSLEETARQIAASPAPCVVLGSGASKNREALHALLAGAPCLPLFLPPHFDQPQPVHLLRAASLCHYARHDIDPLYARACDAEENLDHIAATLRIDPREARAQLAKLTTTQG